MAILIPLTEALAVSGARSTLQQAASWSLATQSGQPFAGFAGALVVDANGLLQPGPLFNQGMLPPAIAALVPQFFSRDAWQVIQERTAQLASNPDGVVVPPPVEVLYALTETPLPAGAETEAQAAQPDQDEEQVPPVPAPLPGQVPSSPAVPDGSPAPTGAPPVAPELPPVVFSPRATYPVTQPSGDFAAFTNLQVATGLAEIAQQLGGPLAILFADVLDLPAAEAAVYRAALAVQQPVISGLERATDLIRPATGTVIGPVETPVEWAQELLQETSQLVREATLETLAAADAALGDARGATAGVVDAALDTAARGVAQVAGLLDVTIQQRIAEAESAQAGAMATLASTQVQAQQLVSALLETPEQFTGQVVGAVKEKFPGLEEQVSVALATAVAAGLTQHTGSYTPPDLSNVLGSFVAGCPDLNALAAGAAVLNTVLELSQAYATGGLTLLSGNLDMGVLAGVVSSAVSAYLAPAREVAERDAFERCPVNIPGLPALNAAKRLGSISPGTYDRLARRNGYDEEMARITYASEIQQLSPQEAINWAYREGRSPEGARPLLERLGFLPADVDRLMSLAPQLPPIQDLLRFAARDVFDPDIVSGFDLDAEFPNDIVPFAEQQGLSSFWMHKYHQARWELPSLTQGFEMYHRIVTDPIEGVTEPVEIDGRVIGHRRISREVLNLLIKAHDIVQYWRPGLTDISFNPLTRTDTKRAFVMDAIDEDEVLRSYLSQGYNERDAGILLRFNKVEKERVLLAETGEQRRAVAAAFGSAYEKGLLDQAAYSFALTDLGYAPEVAALAVQRSTLERKLSVLSQAESTLRRRYVKAGLSEDQAREHLAAYGMPAEAIEERLQLWNLERLTPEDGSESAKERDLTKTEILQIQEVGLITQAEAEERLIGMGYSVEEARIIVLNREMRRLGREMQRSIDAVRQAFLAGTITQGEASTQLDGLGVATETRDAVLQQWADQRELQRLSTLRGAYVFGAMTDAELAAQLGALGLPQEQAERVLAQWIAEREAVRGGE